MRGCDRGNFLKEVSPKTLSRIWFEKSTVESAVQKYLAAPLTNAREYGIIIES